LILLPLVNVSELVNCDTGPHPTGNAASFGYSGGGYLQRIENLGLLVTNLKH
jgi:hypothetical protein